MVIQLFLLSIEKQAFLCKMSPPSATTCCVIGQLVMLIFIQSLFASVRNLFCWTNGIHLRYFCKVHCESWKTCCWKFVEAYPTHPAPCERKIYRTMDEYQITVSVLDKHKIWMYVLFFVFLQNLHYTHTLAAKIMNIGVIKILMQFVTFLLRDLEVWIHRTHIQIHKFWLLC